MSGTDETPSFPDNDIANSMMAGDRHSDAFGAFLDRCKPYIVGAFKRKGIQHVDAENLYQDIVVSMITTPSYQPVRDGRPTVFKAWLSTVITNRAANYFKDNATKVRPSSADPDELLHKIVWNDQGPDVDQMAARLKAIETYLATDASDEVAIDIFKQHRDKGTAIRELCEARGITEGAYYVRKCRLFKRMAEELREAEQAEAVSGTDTWVAAAPAEKPKRATGGGIRAILDDSGVKPAHPSDDRTRR